MQMSADPPLLSERDFSVEELNALLQVSAQFRTQRQVRNVRRHAAPTTENADEEAAGYPSGTTKEKRTNSKQKPSGKQKTCPTQGTEDLVLNRWQAMVKRIQDRRKVSDRQQMHRYAKNGLPKRCTAPVGFGSHVGRWCWREIRCIWCRPT